MSKLIGLFVSVFIIGKCWGSAPLTSAEEVEKTYSDSEVIIEAEVISKLKVWTHGGDVISEAEAFEIEKGILKYQGEFFERFGLANEESPEAKKYMEEWLQTEVGIKSQKKVECLILATFSVSEVLKGIRIRRSSVVHATWSSGILQTCSSVGVNTEVGSQVLLFLKDKEIERVRVMPVGHESLLIGTLSKKRGDEFAQFLDSINIGYVPFDQEGKVDFRGAISFVVSKAIELDTTENGGGIGGFVEDDIQHVKDCIVCPKGVEEVVIVYTEREISLRKLIVEIARQSELDLYYASAGLVFCRPGKDPKNEYPEKNLRIWSKLYEVNLKPEKSKQG